MKNILKILLGIVGTVYLIIIIGVTICLLCYNKYGVTEIFDSSLLKIENDLPPYSKGDLVIVSKNSNNEIQIADDIFFYEVTNGIASVNLGKVTNVEAISQTETTFTINNNHAISSESLIGKTETAKVYKNLGLFLSIMESKFGFLLLVIFPTLLVFLYEIYRVIIEIKTPLENEE